MNRIDKKFVELKSNRRKGFIAYITAGDPSLKVTEKLIPALESAGVDILELGVPFSDPMADGTVIQRASERAIESKTTLKKILLLVSKLRRKVNIPVVLFTYMNPVFRYGWERFAKDAKKSGIDGVLVLDLPVEESKNERNLLLKNGIKMIYLIAPTSTDTRIKLISRKASGFVYYVSRTGVTGVRDSVSHDVGPMVSRIKRFTDLPVAVGFGISKKEHVKEVARFSDAVVVGSAMVSKIEKNMKSKKMVPVVSDFVRNLKGEI
jgi:tryptophan synthase alpha chain